MPINRLPRDALNSGVRMRVMAMSPTKNGPKDQLLCGVPLRRKAGVCQIAQITPKMMLAQNGESFRCNNGNASPRHPNSSPIGPRKRDWSNAGKTKYDGEKGSGL